MITVKIMTVVSLCVSCFSLGFVLSTLILWDGGGLVSGVGRARLRWRREQRRRRKEGVEQRESEVKDVNLAQVYLRIMEKEQHYDENNDA
jgi:hypothetical protein